MITLGTLTVSGGVNGVKMTAGSGTISAATTQITGKFTVGTSGAGTIDLGATNLSGELAAATSGVSVSNLTIRSGNAVISGAGMVTISATGATTFNTNNGLLKLTGATDDLVRVNVNIANAGIVNNTAGSVSLGTLAFTNAANQLTLTDGIFSAGTSTAATNGIVELNNTTLDLLGALNLNGLRISALGGTLTGAGTLTVNNLGKTILGGDFTTSNANLAATGLRATEVIGTGISTITNTGAGSIALGTVTFAATAQNKRLNLAGGDFTAGIIDVSARNTLQIDSRLNGGTLTLAGGALINNGTGTFAALTVNTANNQNSVLAGNNAAIFVGTTNIEGALTVQGLGTDWNLQAINVGLSGNKKNKLINELTNPAAVISFGTLSISDNFTLAGSTSSIGAFNSAVGSISLNSGVGVIRKTLTLEKGAQLSVNGGAGLFAIGNGVLAFDLAETNSLGSTAKLTAGTVSILGGSIKISNGVKGQIYDIINVTGATASDAAIEAAIRRNSGILFKYELASLPSIGGVYSVGVGLASTGEIIAAANFTTSSNTGIATAISAIMDNEAASFKMREVLDKLQSLSAEPEKFSRAVSELNGTDLTTASASMGVDNAHQFNAALGQVFADMTTTSFALAAIREQIDSAISTSASSAGGKPAANYGATGTPTCEKLGGFFKTYGGWGQQNSTFAAAGYDFGGIGMMAGVSYKVAEELRFGGLLGYTASETRITQNFGSTTDGVLRLGGFGQFNWDNLFFNSAPTFGIHLMETRRNLNTLGLAAHSKRTGFDFNWFNQFGHVFDFQGLMITPSFALGMIYMHDPAHEEQNANLANLAVKTYDSWSLTQNVELKFGKTFCWRGLQLLPEIWVGWEHEHLGDNTIGMAFAATPEYGWLSPVVRIPANRAVFGLGITTLFSKRTEVFGRYDQKIWNGGFSTNFMVGLNIRF